MGYKIIAFDFDGTVWKNDEAIGVTLRFLQSAKANGHKLILHTCRGGEQLEEAKRWCTARGIKPDAVNEDIPEIKDSPFGQRKSTKPFANYYIDDSAITQETLWKIKI